MAKTWPMRRSSSPTRPSIVRNVPPPIRAGRSARSASERRTYDRGLRAMTWRLRLLVAALVALGLAPDLANAVPLDTAGMTRCEADGFGIDRDPKGSNLRSAPRADAPIIGHMAPMVQIEKDTWTGTTFRILGYKDGWFLVTDPSPIDGIKLAADHADDGRAWLSAKLVGTTLATPFF